MLVYFKSCLFFEGVEHAPLIGAQGVHFAKNLQVVDGLLVAKKDNALVCAGGMPYLPLLWLLYSERQPTARGLSKEQVYPLELF